MSSIYKYYSLNSIPSQSSPSPKDLFLDSMRYSYLWFSSPKAFNDPYDCFIPEVDNFTYDEFKSYMITRNSKSDNMLDESELENFININYSQKNKVIKELKLFQHSAYNLYGICCFSKINNEILLWSHYANSHKGICIEYNTDNDQYFFSRPFALEDVNYREITANFSIQDIPGSIANITLTKYSKWSYEQEVRLIKFKSGKHEVNRRAVSNVYFGCNIDKMVAEEIISCLSSYGYNNINYYLMIKSNNSFELSAVPYKADLICDEVIEDEDKSNFILSLHHHNEGIKFSALGLYQAAIESHNKAIDLEESSKYYYSRGIDYQNLGMYMNAIEDYSKSIELNPSGNLLNNRSDCYNNRGNCYFRISEYDNSILDHIMALRLNVTSGAAFQNLIITFTSILNNNIPLDNFDQYFSMIQELDIRDEWKCSFMFYKHQFINRNFHIQ